MSSPTHSKVTDVLWRFVRGETPVSAFEQRIYADPAIESFFGPERHLDLISINYRSAEEVDRVREKLSAFLRSQPTFQCECLALRDLDVVDMGEHDHVFKSLQERAVRGDPFWWLAAYSCHVCEQPWLVAQEERHNDVFILHRLSDKTLNQILTHARWPRVFDRLEDLLRIGANFGRSVDFVDPSDSLALRQSVIDLARSRPGIALRELTQLLHLAPEVARFIAQRAIAQDDVDISLD